MELSREQVVVDNCDKKMRDFELTPPNSADTEDEQKLYGKILLCIYIILQSLNYSFSEV